MRNLTRAERRFVFAIVWRGLLLAAAVLVACNAATLNRVDPTFDPPDAGAQCPMNCPLGCCTLGSGMDGYSCTNDSTRAPCEFTGDGIGPVGNYGGKKRIRDAGR
jgi:hypothetical protein